MNIMERSGTASDETNGTPMRQIYPVLLCGGSGTRLWPLSRSSYPKQLLPLASDKTMLQETALRTVDPLFASPLIHGTQEHSFHIPPHLTPTSLEPRRIHLEPCRRPTEERNSDGKVKGMS